MDGSITIPTSCAGLVGLIAALSYGSSAMNTKATEADTVPFFEWSDIAGYHRTNVAAEIQVGDQQLTGDTVVDYYQPRTELGRKLIALRRAYISGGGKLLSWDELDEEMRLRRGGVPDE